MKPANLLPTSAGERIQALDFLRGIAVLGILIVNIQSFSMPGAAYLNPTAYGDLTGLNEWVWWLTHVFGDQKFMTIFSILYGAGIVLVTQRAEERSGSSTGLHYRRTLWLLVIGLIHAHLIWSGDILVAYAICALIAFWFRKKKPLTLMILGLIIVSVHSILYLMLGFSLDFWPPESIESAMASWSPDAAQINSEIVALTGTLSEQVGHNSSSALFMEIFVFLIIFFWRALGLMLVGMAFYKWGILTAGRDVSFYKKGWIYGWALGLPIVIFGAFKNFQEGWSMEYSMYFGSQFNYWGSLLVSFGHLCAIMWIAKSGALPWFRDRLAAVGQMALTNYLMQSIICVFIFWGIGFGLFGSIERKWQLLIVVLIWILQIIWSRPWLNHYRFGPFEWLWRSLTYGKRQVMKK